VAQGVGPEFKPQYCQKKKKKEKKWGGVAQTMYTHMSKYKNDKIKEKK
jgi:glutamine amidotransferase-like uncharacterized protein